MTIGPGLIELLLRYSLSSRRKLRGVHRASLQPLLSADFPDGMVVHAPLFQRSGTEAILDASGVRWRMIPTPPDERPSIIGTSSLRLPLWTIPFVSEGMPADDPGNCDYRVGRARRASMQLLPFRLRNGTYSERTLTDAPSCSYLRKIAHFNDSLGTDVPSKVQKVSVLLEPEEAERFSAFCREKGFKKSALIARLIREHLERERFRVQRPLF